MSTDLIVSVTQRVAVSLCAGEHFRGLARLAGAVCSSAQPGQCAADIIPWMELLSLVQWPAMGVTLLASWLVASDTPARRNVGFWLFLASNALWIAWGWFDGAFALIALQIGLAAMNIRGASKTERQTH